MSKKGDILENPVTGEKAVFLTGTEESDGKRIIVDLTIKPGGAVVNEHVHPSIKESFSVLKGEVGFRLDGEESIAGPGKTVHVPPGVVHDWWNAGAYEAIVRVEISPGTRFEEMILNIFGLAQDGKTNSRGMPGFLQLVLIAKEFEDVVIFTSPPRIIQKILFGLLAPVSRLLGYRGSNPKYRKRLEEARAPVDRQV